MAERRPSSADGSSSGTTSSVAVGTLREDSFDWLISLEGLEGGGGFALSAYRRLWIGTLHCKPDEARAGRIGMRRALEAGENAIASENSLGAKRASGCMADEVNFGRKR